MALVAKEDKGQEFSDQSASEHHTTSRPPPEEDVEGSTRSDASIHSDELTRDNGEPWAELGDSSSLKIDSFIVLQLASVVEFFTEGSSFEALKLSFRLFVYPSEALAHAIASHDFKTVQDLLIADFESVAQEKYAWLHELNEFGYTRDQMAELLLEEANDSPWIVFERQNIQSLSIDTTYQQPSCVHIGGQNLSFSPVLVSAVPASSTGDLFMLSALSTQEKVNRLVQEACVVGGVGPISPDRDEWNGFVDFSDDHCTASVSYAFPGESELNHERQIKRIVAALDGFCSAVSHVQQAGLMCQSFTIQCGPYGQSGAENVELHNLNLSPILLFRKELDRVSRDSENFAFWALLEYSANEILSPVISAANELSSEMDMAHTIYISSLTVQFLWLAFLFYTHAHSGQIQPFFLDCSLKHIVLLGASASHSSCIIDVELQDLTCMGDMVKDSVVVFRKSGRPDKYSRLKWDLLASPEDIMDTWGPEQFLTAPAGDTNPRIYAISIGGGTIKANLQGSDDNDWTWHWTPGTTSTPLVKSFDQYTKILIGTAVTINDACPMDVNQHWMVCSESLDKLGTFQSAWEISERQSGLQGGQFVNFQFNQTWTKMPGNTLKQIQLDLPDNHILPFLQASWGLQVSLCTSVARRVPLRELVDDVMPAFVESLFLIPSQWESLKTTHNILDAFRTKELQEWLGQLSSELQQFVARLVRYILLTLQYTGIDRRAGHLIIAWIQRNKPFRCFKVPCERESYWA